MAAGIRSQDRKRVRLVRRHRPLGPGERVLDVGCGKPSFLAALVRETLAILERTLDQRIECVLRTDPELLIVSDYKLDTASLANAWLAHPAVKAISGKFPTAQLPASYWACGAPQSLDSVEILSHAVNDAR